MVDDSPPQTLPIAERLPLSGYSELKDWLGKLLEPRGMQAQCANAIGVSEQNVVKWLKGSRPNAEVLEKLARWAGVDHFQLQLLAHQIKQPNRPQENERFTETAKGAMVGRAWEELNQYDNKLAEQYAALLQNQIDSFLRQRAHERRRPDPKRA